MIILECPVMQRQLCCNLHVAVKYPMCTQVLLVQFLQLHCCVLQNGLCTPVCKYCGAAQVQWPIACGFCTYRCPWPLKMSLRRCPCPHDHHSPGTFSELLVLPAAAALTHKLAECLLTVPCCSRREQQKQQLSARFIAAAGPSLDRLMILLLHTSSRCNGSKCKTSLNSGAAKARIKSVNTHQPMFQKQ